MAYMKIRNLYQARDILLFKECYALEKIHGTSAHVSWNNRRLGFFAGGANHSQFVALFDQEVLTAKFIELDHDHVIVYGEAFGGKMQRMRDTYGDSLQFIVFEVKVGDAWLAVPDMDEVATGLGFEVVPWDKIPATTAAVVGNTEQTFQ